MPGTALVLSGGGAKGAFQVGAEKYLREEKGFSWDVIAGVSAGSLNASMLAMEKYARLEEIWRNSSNDMVYTGKFDLWAVVKMVFGARSALGNKPLQRLIEAEWEPGRVTKPLSVGVVSLRTGEYRMFTPAESDFPAAVLASTSMPVYWPPVRGVPPFLDMVDGGVRNISPLGEVLLTDPDKVVIINCSPHDPSPHPEPFKGVLPIATRTLDVAFNEILLTDVQEFLRINRNVKEAEAGGVTLHHEDGRPYKYFEAIVIEPIESLGDSLDFSAPESRRRMDIGRERARAVVP